MNQPYDIARYRALTAALDWASLDLVVIAFGGTPEFVATDPDIATIIARGNTTLLMRSQQVTGPSVAVDGTARTDPVVIPGVTPGSSVTHLIVAEDNPALPDNSVPLLYIDEAYELPFDTNGLDLVVQPDWLEGRGWWRP